MPEGAKIPQSEKDEVLLQDLSERHGVPQYIAGKMLDAAQDQPSQCRDFTFEERVALWRVRRTRGEEDIDACGETRVRCNLLVFGARTVDDFSSKVYKLFERLSPRDGVEWVMFDRELRKIVGLILP